jgi:fermentation-respiration switch protein FrsA (DUF1100 family)
MLDARPAQHEICCISPADANLSFQEMEFPAHDGMTLRGWYIPPQNGVVIIMQHGYSIDRRANLLQATWLADAGYGSLLYDAYATGESEGSLRSYGWRDPLDVQNAIAWVMEHGQPVVRFGFYGCSTGGEITVFAGARYPQIEALVADGIGYAAREDLPAIDHPAWPIISPMSVIFLRFLEWRIGQGPPSSLRTAIAQIENRRLLLISTGDSNAIERIQAEYYMQFAGEHTTHWNIPDSSHCQGPQTHPDQYATKLTRFFNTAFFGE